MENEKKIQTDLILNTDNTASWTFREEGDTLASTYAGTFQFRCFLNPLETLAAGRLYRELLGTNSAEASEQERFLAFALSQLKHRIVKAPPFWNTDTLVSGNIPDLNIVSLTLDKAISAELLYKEELKKRKETALEKAAEASKAIQERLNAKPKEDESKS